MLNHGFVSLLFVFGVVKRDHLIDLGLRKIFSGLWEWVGIESSERGVVST